MDPAEARPDSGFVRRVGVAAGLVSLLAWAGCGREEPPPPIPLVELFPLAERHLETTTVAPGNPSSSAELQEGWSPGNPRAPEPFAWGTGTRSVLSLTIVEPRPLVLELTGWPHRFPGAPPQVVEVALNGHGLGRLELGSSWRPRSYRVELPAGPQSIGLNHLELGYGYSARPSETGAGRADNRSLAAAWSRFELRGTRRARPPETSGRDLLLPIRTAVSFALPSAGGGELSIARVSAWRGERRSPGGGRAPTLLVRVDRTDGEPGASYEIPAGGAGPHALPLPATESPLRVTLAAAAGGARARAASGLRVYAPSLSLPLPAAEAARGRGSRRADPGRPNVLVYLIDTLRADHLGCYGYPRATSPRIDRFAGEAILFTSAEAQTSWTRPAVASLFTGLNPQVHGTNNRRDGLPPDVVVMAEAFRDLGYATAAVSTNRNVSRHFGFDRGFDTFVSLKERTDTTEIHQLSDRVNEEALAWLDARPAGAPFFLYLHATDPHAPYEPRSPYRELFAGAAAGLSASPRETLDALQEGRLEPTPEVREALIGLYDAEIAFNDASFGELLDELASRDLYESTLIVLLSDHGEEFNDHGRWSHGRTLYQEQLRVPLIVRLPGGEGGGRRIDEPARQIDLLPTLLDYLGGAVPAGVQGRSLRGWLAGSRAASSETVPSFALLDLDHHGLRSVRVRGRKLLHNWSQVGQPVFQLYDLERDPAETRNLVYEQGVWSSYLLSVLESTRFWQPLDAPEVELEGELRETLKALGYLK